VSVCSGSGDPVPWELRGERVNVCFAVVVTESSERADSRDDGASTATSNPAMSSQNTSEFDFNKFFPIDNVSIATQSPATSCFVFLVVGHV